MDNDQLTPEQAKAIEMILNNEHFICATFNDFVKPGGEIVIREQCQYSIELRHLKKHLEAILLELYEH
jgi:hypothetical protein